jgi:hypothetical protein
MPYRMSLSAITTKTLFLSSLLISLCYKSVNRASCIRTDISVYRDCLTDIPIELVDMPVELADMLIEVI